MLELMLPTLSFGKYVIETCILKLLEKQITLILHYSVQVTLLQFKNSIKNNFF